MGQFSEVIEDGLDIPREFLIGQADRSQKPLKEVLLISAHEPAAGNQAWVSFLVGGIPKVPPVVILKVWTELRGNHLLGRVWVRPANELGAPTPPKRENPSDKRDRRHRLLIVWTGACCSRATPARGHFPPKNGRKKTRHKAGRGTQNQKVPYATEGSVASIESAGANLRTLGLGSGSAVASS